MFLYRHNIYPFFCHIFFIFISFRMVFSLFLGKGSAREIPFFSDAAYYANWLSIVYSLKDRLLENLLVFSSKIEDLTLLTLVYLQTKGKRENGSLLLRNLRFAKIRHIGDYFADSSCKIRDGFTDFGVGSCHHFMPWSELCFALSLI